MKLQWFKSTRSNASGNCVEVALEWFKSTRSKDSGACVEVATQTTRVHVRDSKDPDGPVLTFDIDTWRDFVDFIKAS